MTVANALCARLLDLAPEQADTLASSPALRFSGMLDTLPDDLAEDLEVVLREALSNIARHVNAHRRGRPGRPPSGSPQSGIAAGLGRTSEPETTVRVASARTDL